MISSNYEMEMDEDPGIDFENFVLEDELKKYKGVRANGWNIVVRIYSPKREQEKKIGNIIIPNSEKFTDEAEFRNCMGLVVQKSVAAYKDERYKDTGVWCEIGDWVVFPRHAGYKIKYNNIPLFVLKEDQVDLVIDDPRTIGR